MPSTSSEHGSKTFRLDSRWPFVYLKFDHIGPGRRQADDEPSTRIWLRLVNNCRLPIVVRGGQGINGGAPGEIVINNVVRLNPPVLTITPSPSPILDHPPLPTALGEPGHAAHMNKSSPNPPVTQPKTSGDDEAYMPVGYPPPDVVSTETIMPSREVLFSVPVNFVSKKWHFEITFNFASEQVDERIPEELFFVDPNVRGQVGMSVSYGLDDVPTQYQNEVEKLNEKFQTKDSKMASSR